MSDEGQDVAAREGAGPLTAQRAAVLRWGSKCEGRGRAGGGELPYEISYF